MGGALFLQAVALIIIFCFVNTFIKCMHSKYCTMCKK
jgi:hypothetical protein